MGYPVLMAMQGNPSLSVGTTCFVCVSDGSCSTILDVLSHGNDTIHPKLPEMAPFFALSKMQVTMGIPGVEGHAVQTIAIRR